MGGDIFANTIKWSCDRSGSQLDVYIDVMLKIYSLLKSFLLWPQIAHDTGRHRKVEIDVSVSKLAIIFEIFHIFV